jgi:hypothetical protein
MFPAAHLPRRLLVCLLAMGALALLSAAFDLFDWRNLG